LAEVAGIAESYGLGMLKAALKRPDPGRIAASMIDN
jgi:hypothetical protein